MPVTLVTDPAHVHQDAAKWPWTHRLKYAEVRELLVEYRAANAAIGRQHCPVADYLAAHLDDDIIEVDAHIYSHPEWGPAALCETCHATLAFNHSRSHPHGPFIAGWVQHFALLHLVRHHPAETAYGRARGPFEAMLKAPRMKFASPAAAYVALAYLNAGHPNPRCFLEKPEVAAKFAPFGIDASRFLAPDFD
jgi:hypothetical protein